MLILFEGHHQSVQVYHALQNYYFQGLAGQYLRALPAMLEYVSPYICIICQQALKHILELTEPDSNVRLPESLL